MSNEFKISALINRIKTVFLEIESDYNYLASKYDISAEPDPLGDLEISNSEVFDSISRNLDVLNISIILYLEMIGGKKTLEIYLSTVSEKISSGKNLFEFNQPYDSDEFYALFPLLLRKFLYPLNIFNDGDKQEINVLENILKGTGKIIHDANLKKVSETEIYNEVKKYIRAAFPTTKNASNEFPKMLKTYKPDILIPELSCVIEYKYADSYERLKQVIDEIHIDVTNYSGNSKYNRFYAVIVMSKNFLSPSQCSAAWNEKGFSNSWQPIFSVIDSK